MPLVLDGTTGIAGPLNGTLGATTPSTVASTTVVASSTIKGATTIAVGNATPSASGAGITFPATQSASTDANTLDDYEEGTFTPTSIGFTITGTQVLTGTYTKIGRIVHATIKQTATNVASSAGSNSRIEGLPFLPADENQSCGSCASVYGVALSPTGLIGSGGAIWMSTAYSSGVGVVYGVVYRI